VSEVGSSFSVSLMESGQRSNAGGTAAVRRLGRFELRELVGRSQRTMAWRVHDPRSDRELLLVLPRAPLPSDDAVRVWELNARRASRLGHAGLAFAVEVGSHDRFSYIAYEVEGHTLLSRLNAAALTPREGAGVVSQVARVLAAAHEAGSVHGDLQPHLIFVSPSGQVKLAGLEVASVPTGALTTPADVDSWRNSVLRAGGRSDPAALGVLLFWVVTGRPPMEEPDTEVVAGRILSGLSESLKLPATFSQPVAEPLRAIVQRSVDRHEGVRYRSARSLLMALDGWLKADVNSSDSTFKVLVDRVRSDGLLPASEHTRERMANLRLLEGESTREMSELLLGDLAVALELLRVVNTAQQRDARRAGYAGVLTLHRAVAMLGLDGVRRSALSLKPWPGPLKGQAVEDLEALLVRCRNAARVARLLRPQGYDPEAAYMVGVLQNLGRIVLQYHFPEQAQQVNILMFPPGATDPEHAEMRSSLSEDLAAFSVLGVDLASVGIAIGRHLGLDASMLNAIRRLPAKGGIFPSPRTDEEALCQTGSCANDAIDALLLAPEKAAAELNAIVNRYSRGLRLSARAMRDALIPNGLTQAVSRAWVKINPTLPALGDDDW